MNNQIPNLNIIPNNNLNNIDSSQMFLNNQNNMNNQLNNLQNPNMPINPNNILGNHINSLNYLKTIIIIIILNQI